MTIAQGVSILRHDRLSVGIKGHESLTRGC